MQNSNVSVIIPFFNSEKFFLQLFECLNQQKIAENDEIIFVDNGSTDNSAILVKDFCTRFKNAKYYFFNDKSDSYAARNFGVKCSQNEVLIFTDSDCLPEPFWIDEIKKNIKKGTVISGKVNIYIENSSNMWEVFDSNAHMTNNHAEKSGNIATANMAVYKEDFLNVGKFLERYSGGDYEWSQRSINCGMKILYNKNVVVNHPPRTTKNQIIKKEARIAYGQGKNDKLKNRNFLKCMIIYILKIFYLKPQMKYIKIFIKYNIPFFKIVYFFFYFFYIRIIHIKFFIYGYRNIEPRKLNI